MKYFSIILLLISVLFPDEYEATVYLNNGTVIRGTIIDEKPNFYIQIRSGGKDFVYQPFEIKEIVRGDAGPIELPSIDVPIIKEPKIDMPKDKRMDTSESKIESQEPIDETPISMEKEQEYILSMNLKLPFFLSRNIEYLYDEMPGFGLEFVTPFGVEFMNKKISILASVNKTFLKGLGNASNLNPLRLGLGVQTSISSFNFMYGLGFAFESDIFIYKTMGVSYTAPLIINNKMNTFRYSLDARSVSIDGMPPQESYDWTSWVDLGFSIIYPFSISSVDNNSANRIAESNKSIKKNKFKDKTASLAVGLASNKNFNLIQLTKDFKFFKQGGLFIAVGIPNFYALGLTIQTNYNDTGFIAGLSRGKHDHDWFYTAASLAYQWRIKKSTTFFSIGVGVNSFKDEEYRCDYYGGPDSNCYMLDRTYTLFYPILSIDTRF